MRVSDKQGEGKGGGEFGGFLGRDRPASDRALNPRPIVQHRRLRHRREGRPNLNR